MKRFIFEMSCVLIAAAALAWPPKPARPRPGGQPATPLIPPSTIAVGGSELGVQEDSIVVDGNPITSLLTYDGASLAGTVPLDPTTFSTNNGQLSVIGGGGGGSSDLVAVSGVCTNDGVLKSVSYTAFSGPPGVACVFAEAVGELAQIEVLSVTTTNFTYQLRSASGIVTDGWHVKWLAVGE